MDHASSIGAEGTIDGIFISLYTAQSNQTRLQYNIRDIRFSSEYRSCVIRWWIFLTKCSNMVRVIRLAHRHTDGMLNDWLKMPTRYDRVYGTKIGFTCARKLT